MFSWEGFEFESSATVLTAASPSPHPIIAGFKEPRSQHWVKEPATTPTVAGVPCHYTWTFDELLYRLRVMRSICWAAKDEDVERLSGLCLIGARVAD